MGKPWRFTLDLAEDDENPPDRGDILISTIATYRILDVREVESRVWCNRWALTYERFVDRKQLRPDTPGVELGARLVFTRPYGRGEGPRTPGRVGAQC